MKYFYYQKTQTGKWSPVLSDTEPVKISADKTQNRRTTKPVLLEERHVNLSLEVLSEIFPVPEEVAYA